MFMHDEGRVVTDDWTVDFMLGVGKRANAWTNVMLSDFRSTLAPILSVHRLGRRMMPDVLDAELDRIKATAHYVIADAVTVLYRHCAVDTPERGPWARRTAYIH